MIRTGSESMLDLNVTLVNLLCSNRTNRLLNKLFLYLFYFLLDLTLTLNVMRRNRSKIVALLLNNDNCKTIEYTYRPLHITLKHLVHTREEFYLLLFFSLLFQSEILNLILSWCYQHFLLIVFVCHKHFAGRC